MQVCMKILMAGDVVPYKAKTQNQYGI